tara:strand:+ start:363 stop:830 length:468 start_codon:yes stop_codon:yes gene_type:complete
MNILIVEDEDNKRFSIEGFLSELFSDDVEFDFARSLRAGLLKASLGNDQFDLLLLDMSMPHFDPSVEAPSGAVPDSFAGEEMMSQMELRDICIPVIVVTQYTVFEKGSVTLPMLDCQYRERFGSFYRGIVYYSSVSDDWKNNLKKIMSDLGFCDV